MKKISFALFLFFVLFIILISNDLNFTDFFEFKVFFTPFQKLDVYQLILWTTTCSICVLFYYTVRKIKKIRGDKTFSFIEFFLIVFGIYFTFLGYINGIIVQYYFPLSVKVDVVLENNLVCLLTIFTSYLIFYILFPKKYTEPESLYEIDFDKFRRSVIILNSLSIVGTLLFWAYFGSIPVFSGHGVINVNLDIEEKIPILIQYGSSLMPVYALYSGMVYLIHNKKDYLILSMTLTLFGLLVLSGVRFPIITAFILAIILVFPLIKSEKKYLFQIAFILLLFFLTLGLWRNRDIEMVSGEIQISALGSAVSQLGVEFTEYARLTGALNRPDYIPNETAGKELIVDNIIITSLPNVIWNLVGIDKKDYQKMTYITFGSLIYESNFTGIRPGVFGEVYYGFGKPGLIVWSVLLTIFICILDNKRMKYQDYSYQSFHNIMITLWGVIIVLTVIGHFKGTTHFFTTTALIFYSIIVPAKKFHLIDPQ